MDRDQYEGRLESDLSESLIKKAVPMKITVRVKANAKKNSIEATPDGSWKVAVTAPAREGKANQAVMSLLAKHFAVAKSKVRLVMGQKHSNKVFEIDKG